MLKEKLLYSKSEKNPLCQQKENECCAKIATELEELTNKKLINILWTNRTTVKTRAK